MSYLKHLIKKQSKSENTDLTIHKRDLNVHAGPTLTRYTKIYNYKIEQKVEICQTYKNQKTIKNSLSLYIYTYIYCVEWLVSLIR